MARHSIPYAVLRFWVGTGMRFYFRNIKINGSLRSLAKSSKAPVIVVANHQNALLDPIVLGVISERQINFLARAAVFKSPLHAKLLSYLHMQPVYRPVDGVDVRTSNEPIFKTCTARLNEGAVIGIFPEGNHDLPKRLRPLKKGAVRMAAGFGKPVIFQIFGIDYLNHSRPFTDLEITIAPELEIDLKIAGPESPQAIELIRQELSASVLDIVDEEKRIFLLALEQIHWTNGPKGFDVENRKQILSKLEVNQGMLDLLKPVLNDYRDLLQHHSINDEDVQRYENYGWTFMIAHAHSSKWAYLVNLPLLLLQRFLEARMVEDVVFKGTFRFLFWFLAIQLSWFAGLAYCVLNAQYLFAAVFFGSLFLSLLVLRNRAANPGPIWVSPKVLKRAASLRKAIMTGIHGQD